MRRLVITGGPGAGKSTVVAALASELGARGRIVPEVATHLLGGLFPHIESDEQRRSVQRAIHRVQLSLEEVHQSVGSGESLLVCDRGLLDGAAYWPEGAAEFFRDVGGSEEQARARYDAVLFLQSAACAGHPLDRGNPTRRETREQARAIDERLEALWKPHPAFFRIEAQPTLERKVERALECFRTLSAHS